VFVVAMDAAARTAARPEEIPLGIVTSLVGVPAFLLILRSLRGRRAGL
jgi:iron complex transport system permease protein